jgi:hypothetical protein
MSQGLVSQQLMSTTQVPATMNDPDRREFTHHRSKANLTAAVRGTYESMVLCTVIRYSSNARMLDKDSVRTDPDVLEDTSFVTWQRPK